MEMRIAIIEDNYVHQKEIEKILYKWPEKFKLHVDMYDSVSGFFRSTRKVDLIFLDIEMKEEGEYSGLNMASYMREKNDMTPIVFITAHREHIRQGYKVRALDFIIKPAKQEEIFWCLDRVWEQIRDVYYIHNSKNNIYKIRYSDILYFESDKHYMKIVTVDGTKYIRASVAEILQTVTSVFAQCHRGYIVNLGHIEAIKGNEIYLDNGERIIMPSRYRKRINALFIQQFRL